MADAGLRQFMEKVMRINLNFAGMGGASAAVFGSSSTNDSLVNELRASALAFAAERAKPQPGSVTLQYTAGQLEGVLRSVHVVGGLSETELDNLIDELHKLVA
jgi:hypothetical protein